MILFHAVQTKKFSVVPLENKNTGFEGILCNGLSFHVGENYVILMDFIYRNDNWSYTVIFVPYPDNNSRKEIRFVR